MDTDDGVLFAIPCRRRPFDSRPYNYECACSEAVVFVHTDIYQFIITNVVALVMRHNSNHRDNCIHVDGIISFGHRSPSSYDHKYVAGVYVCVCVLMRCFYAVVDFRWVNICTGNANIHTHMRNEERIRRR